MSKSATPMSFPELLEKTAVYQQVIAPNTFSVPPKRAMLFNFTVGEQGGSLGGAYQIAGGTGNDIVFTVKTANQIPSIQPVRVQLNGNFEQRFGPGNYVIWFDNSMSAISAKSVTANFVLEYYR